jgi:hypothetical protein
MTRIDPVTAEALLGQELRRRAADLGDEDTFYRELLAATTRLPQRRWVGVLGQGTGNRTGIALVAALVAAGLVVAAIGGAFDTRQRDIPPRGIQNGPVLVEGNGRAWWIDPVTGVELTEGLPELPRGIQNAAWSRDGRMLALDVAGDLELLDPSTSERRVLASCEAIGWQCAWPGRTRSLEWSPDDSTIAVAFGSGLWLVDVATRQVTNLIERRPDDDEAPILASPSWSPDGRWIAFELDDTILTGLGAIRQLHIIRADGSERHRLEVEMPVHSLGLTQPIWPVDGPGIVLPASDDWTDVTQGGSATLSFIAIAVVDGVVVGSPVKLADVGKLPCVVCVTFTYGPDGSAVILDDGEVVSVADVSAPGIRRLEGLSAHPLAWRPIP